MDLSIEAIKQLDVIKLENQIYKVFVELPLLKFISQFMASLLQKVGEMWVSGDIKIVDDLTEFRHELEKVQINII